MKNGDSFRDSMFHGKLEDRRDWHERNSESLCDLAYGEYSGVR